MLVRIAKDCSPDYGAVLMHSLSVVLKEVEDAAALAGEGEAAAVAAAGEPAE